MRVLHSTFCECGSTCKQLNDCNLVFTLLPATFMHTLCPCRFAEARAKDNPDLAEAYKKKIAAADTMSQARQPEQVGHSRL